MRVSIKNNKLMEIIKEKERRVNEVFKKIGYQNYQNYFTDNRYNSIPLHIAQALEDELDVEINELFPDGNKERSCK